MKIYETYIKKSSNKRLMRLKEDLIKLKVMRVLVKRDIETLELDIDSKNDISDISRDIISDEIFELKMYLYVLNDRISNIQSYISRREKL